MLLETKTPHISSTFPFVGSQFGAAPPLPPVPVELALMLPVLVVELEATPPVPLEVDAVVALLDAEE